MTAGRLWAALSARLLGPAPDPRADLADQRAAYRHRRVRMAMFANLANKGSGFAVMVLGVSQTVGYLGPERFGAWMTLASFAALLSFLDFGVGNALINRVARISASEDPVALREAITGGLGFLLGLGLIIAVVLQVLASVLPWDHLVKVADPAISHEVRLGAEIMAWLFGLSLFSNGCQRVYAGLQSSHIAYGLNVFTNVLVIGLLLLATHQRANIPTLLLVTYGVQVLLPLSLLLHLAQQHLLAPVRVWWRTTVDARQALLHTGLIFMVLQIGSLVFVGLDPLILASGPGAVAASEYAIVQRLFLFVMIPLMTFNAPYWGAYAEAHARGDQAFVRATLKRNLRLTLLAGACGVLIVGSLAPWLISIWTHGVLHTSTLVLVLYGLLVIADSSGNTLAMFLNGTGLIKPQLGSVFILCAIALPAKFYLVQKAGVAGIVGASLISYVIAVQVYYGIFLRRRLFPQSTNEVSASS